jgi:hypothetical protein
MLVGAAILLEDRIDLIPLRIARTVKGFLKGIDTDDEPGKAKRGEEPAIAPKGR